MDNKFSTIEKRFLKRILLGDINLAMSIKSDVFKDIKNKIIFDAIQDLINSWEEVDAGLVLKKIMENNNIQNGDTWPDELPSAINLLEVLNG